MAFGAGRYLDVLYTGDWSPVVKLGAPPGALPAFAAEQSAALKAARPDWVALNHYTSRYGVAYENGTGIKACERPRRGRPSPPRPRGPRPTPQACPYSAAPCARLHLPLWS
jgi:beta-glucosidase/6-phospho-beta-glucosidase/beta-galactosidase